MRLLGNNSNDATIKDGEELPFLEKELSSKTAS